MVNTVSSFVSHFGRLELLTDFLSKQKNLKLLHIDLPADTGAELKAADLLADLPQLRVEIISNDSTAIYYQDSYFTQMRRRKQLKSRIEKIALERGLEADELKKRLQWEIYESASASDYLL